MDILLEKCGVDTLEMILDATVTTEVTGEVTVSDTLPDILRITDCEGTVFVRAKEAENSTAVLSGTVETEILFVSDAENGVFVLEASLPFSLSAPCADLSPTEKIQATVRITRIDAKVINSRKVSVRAEILAQIRVYSPKKLEYCVETGLCPIKCEMLSDSVSFVKRTAVREKSFIVAGEWAVSDKAMELLKTRTVFVLEESKGVGSKVIVKGKVKIEALFEDEDFKLLSEEFEQPFSQIIETECEKENAQYAAEVFLTGTYCTLEDSDSSQVLCCEIHAVAQIEAKEIVPVQFISDMYSNQYVLECKKISQTMAVETKQETQRITFEGDLKTPAAVREIGDMHICLGKASVENKENSANLIVPFNVTACYYSTEDSLLSISADFELKGMCALNGMSVSAVKLANPDIKATVRDGELAFSVDVDAEFCLEKLIEAELVMEASYNEEDKRELSDLPSIVMMHFPEGESLWSIAKKHCSSVELIVKANPNLDEKGNGGAMLLIPKAR